MSKLVIILGLLSQIPNAFSQPIVQVEQGQIQGKAVPFHNEYLNTHKDIDVFLGIPYAEQPIGEGRFSPPLPKEPWAEGETYNATYNRDICVQEQSGSDAVYFSHSEDCLHLNVYAPNPKVCLIIIREQCCMVCHTMYHKFISYCLLSLSSIHVGD